MPLYFYSMKKLLFIFIAVLGITGAKAQIEYPSNFIIIAPNVYRVQMLNTSNTIPNAVLDTATNTTALYLTVSKRTTSGLATAYPLFMNATLSFIVSGIKVSGNPAGSITLEQSFDGTVWAPVRTDAMPLISTVETDTVGVVETTTATYTYTNPDAYTILDVATAQSFAWLLGGRGAIYYRIKILGTSTQTSSWRAWLCFTGK